MNRKISHACTRILAGGISSLFLLTSCQKKTTDQNIELPEIKIGETITNVESSLTVQPAAGQVVSEDTEYFKATETASLSLGENGEYWKIRRVGNENGMVELGNIYELDNHTYINEEYILLFFDREAKLQKQLKVNDLISDAYNQINGIYPAGTNEFVIAVTPPWEYENAYRQIWLYRYDFSGNRVGDRIVVNKKTDNADDSVHFYSVLIDQNGQIFASCEQSSTNHGQEIILAVFDASGTELFTLKDNSGGDAGSWRFSDLFASEGRVYATGGDKNGFFLASVDTDKQSLGERISHATLDMYQTQFVGDSLYSSDGLSLKKINIQDGQVSNVFEWKNLDLPEGANSDWIMLTEDKIMVESRSEDLQSLKWHLLEKMEKNPNAGKKVIQIVSMNVGVDRAVYRYNQTNPEYRIEVRNYSDKMLFETEDAETAWINQLHMDILSGNMPDILIKDMYSNLNFPMLSSRGVFADLNPLMSADSDFNESDYFENILKISETDGELFYVGIDFLLQGMLGNGSLTGDIQGWTFGDFAAFADNLPDGVALFENGMTADLFLAGILEGSLEEYIDYTNKTADFQSDRFVSLLNFCKNYCRTANGPVNDLSLDNGAISANILLKRGELALSIAHIYSAESYWMILDSFGENVVVLGYPSQNIVGPICESRTSIGISASSPYQQATWEFVKQLLSEQEQREITDWAMPVRKSVFEEKVQKQMQSNGGQVSNQMNSLGEDNGFNLPLSEAGAQSLRQTIASVTVGRVSDTKINSIIQEEVQSFFSGDKPAEAVAETIQSRVQTHLNEL